MVQKPHGHLRAVHQLVSPFSAHVDIYLSQHSPLLLLSDRAIVHTYPTDVLIDQRVPPFKPPVLPFVLNSKLILKLPFLSSDFCGWETFQNSCAALVLHENAGDITSFAFGSVEDFSRLYQISF